MAFGDHHVGCRGNGDLIHRHNSLRDTIFSAAQSAALAPRKEVLSLVSSSSSRPADIFFPCWKQGKPTAFDVTVISPLQQLTIQGASVTPSYAIAVGEDRKFHTHLENCLAAGVSFVPLMVESLGGWSDEAVDTLRLIGKQQAQRMGLPPSRSINHLFRLSIVLWCGNTCMLASRMPIHLPSENGIE